MHPEYSCPLMMQNLQNTSEQLLLRDCNNKSIERKLWPRHVSTYIRRQLCHSAQCLWYKYLSEKSQIERTPSSLEKRLVGHHNGGAPRCEIRSPVVISSNRIQVCTQVLQA